MMDKEKYTNRTNDFFKKVYSWMFLGLLLSAIVAYLIPNQFRIVLSFLFSSSWIYIISFLFYLGFIWFLSARVFKLSYNTGVILFLFQALLMGIFISALFVVYNLGSIALIFFITSLIFGIMAIFGYLTKIDLSSLGPILSIGLVGIIIVGIINIFLGNDIVSTIISVFAIIIFLGFTAYDHYVLKRICHDYKGDDLKKLALLGALMLYLDFINLFLNLLSLFGDR